MKNAFPLYAKQMHFAPKRCLIYSLFWEEMAGGRKDLQLELSFNERHIFDLWLLNNL